MAIGGSDGMLDKHDNPGMLAAEQAKYRKYELAYAHIGHSLWRSYVLASEH